MTEKVLEKIKEMKKDKEFSIKVIESLCKSEKNKDFQHFYYTQKRRII